MRMNRKMKMSMVLIAISTLFLGIILGRIGLSQSDNLLKSVVEPGSMVTEASYIIFTDGTNVYARNGTTGEIEFQSTNASYVIQSSINNLGATGGTVFIKAGTYNLTSSLIINRSDFTIEGEGWSGWLYQKGGQTVLIKEFNGTTINITYPPSSFDPNYGSFTIRNLAITNLKSSITQSPYSGDGIDINGAVWFTLENVKVETFNGTGISIINSGAHSLRFVQVSLGEGNGYGIYYNNTWDWQWYYAEADANAQNAGYAAARFDSGQGSIIGGHFEGWRSIDIRGGSYSLTGTMIPWAAENAVHIESGDVFISNCQIEGGNSNGNYSGAQGAVIYTSSSNTRIINSKAASLNGTYSVYSTQYELTLLSNTMGDGVYAGGDYATIIGDTIWPFLNLTGTNSKVVGNRFGGTITPGTGNIIKNNNGFATENSGNATISNNGWVAHGLSATPTALTLTPTAYNVTAYVLSVNSTHIQIGVYYTTTGTNVTTPTTIYWQAEA